jgi:hypothetical protein
MCRRFRKKLGLACLAALAAALCAQQAAAIGYYNLPGSLCQCFGYGNGGFRSKKSYIFFSITENYIISSRSFGFSGSSKTGFHSGKRLNFECNMFDDMSHPGSAFNSGKKSAATTFGTTMFNH